MQGRRVATTTRRRDRLFRRGRTLALSGAAKVLRAIRPGPATEARLLRWSWVTRDAERLDEYLVIGWQNPRINIQSILIRHALLRRLFVGAFEDVMAAELRFAVELNEVLRLESVRTNTPINSFLDAERQARIREVSAVIADREHEFEQRWRALLVERVGQAAPSPAKLSVLELACGSANDYRAFADFGLTPFLDYLGIDLNPKNIANARRRFPDVRFEVGNAMDTKQADGSFDVVIASDLFEHLSIPVAARVLAEAGRVARHAVVLSFFNMAEIPEDADLPVAAYHWNRLSRAKYEAALAGTFGTVSVTPIAEWLKRDFGYGHTYNPPAYTMVAER
jgi:ubiquinone/menaquinone biosynthesis C-methylase UbiE